MVVERDKIFPSDAFQGFMPLSYNDFFNVIMKHYHYKERTDELENDPSYLQIISYVWLINPTTKKAFIYKRAPSKSEYKEKRHLNKLSGGIGGHIDKESTEPQDPMMHAALREMNEELIMKEYPPVKFIGYINDDSNIFSEVHFGVVGLAQTNEEAQPADGMANGAFYSAAEVDKLFNDPANEVESWTKLSWPVIRKYILAK